ncbi:Ubiquitin domain-containing protein UBFD1 [Eumeta japonica]|uniref:Ubiquitin domain-containing protein UBFD1 n=1 Tax=Eumeta variegata TaxID=151549 RepID=A0A4C1WVL7_EUMVA|nr:Ubiquitin domain-containing protein UBFD1 [Eumeta japonica]
MDYIASEKGDSSENRDPNSLFANGNTKTGRNDNADTENVKIHMEAPVEVMACTSEVNDEAEESGLSDIPEQVEFTVVFNKAKYNITYAYDATILELKTHLERVCGIPQSAQKLIIKGKSKDDTTLRDSGITKGSKIMLVGSKMDDIMAVKSAPKEVLDEKSNSQTNKEPLSIQKIHRKVLDKGIPPDAMPGIKGVREPLPPVPLSGMLNKYGGKVRLTFKPEQDQLWLGTKERTEKLAMTSIKSITSEPIKDHEEYHIMGLQLGPTEASRYWVYWVPAQYIEAIKDAVLGVWQFF